jgi:hypothetical protein
MLYPIPPTGVPGTGLFLSWACLLTALDILLVSTLRSQRRVGLERGLTLNITVSNSGEVQSVQIA